MYRAFTSRPGSLAALAAMMAALLAPSSHAADNGLVVYLSAYLSGDYYYAPVPDLLPNESQQEHIQPIQLSLPRDFRRSVELGNHDISADGQIIVFAARTKRRQDWDIYTGTPDYDKYSDPSYTEERADLMSQAEALREPEPGLEKDELPF